MEDVSSCHSQVHVSNIYSLFNLKSGWSDILRIRQEKQRAISVPGQCAAPIITEISKGCLRIQWNPPDNVMSSVIYQLHRVNLQPSSIIYQGQSSSVAFS